MRFFPLYQACFGTTLSNDYVARAVREEEPFYHGGFTVAHIATPENLFGGARVAYEHEFGPVEWFELPGYPISGISLAGVPTEDLSSYFVRGMIGGWPRETVMLEEFFSPEDPQYIVDREIEFSSEGKGGLRLRMIALKPNLRSELAVKIVSDARNTTITREQWERYCASDDDQTSLCLEVYKFMVRLTRLKGLERLEAPEEMMRQEWEILEKSREALQALNPNLSVPDPRKRGWETEMRRYLEKAGLDLATADKLMEGRFPEQQGSISTWITQAVLTRTGKFTVVYNDIQRSSNVEGIFPVGPSRKSEDERAYHAELCAVLELSLKSIADLPRIARLARRYNQRLKFD